MPLPHDVWYHYYDRPCEFCEENIEMRDDHHFWAECEMCDKLMCEECKYEVSCHVCDEKIKEKKDFDMPDGSICKECMDSCEVCDEVTFHPGCREGHLKTCNPQGRAKRAVAYARQDVEYMEAELKQAKDKLTSLKEELEAKKKALVEAEKKQKQLKP